MPDRRDPFANLDPSKLVSLDGKEERPPAKRASAASEVQFAPPRDDTVLELDLPPPRRGTTAPQPRPTGPQPRPTGPQSPPRTTGPISAPPPAARTTAPLPPPPAAPEPGPIAAPAPVRGAAPPSPRMVFAGGMALALALAFLPAHLYASMAERSYDTIRLEVTHTEPAVNDAIYRVELEEREAAIDRMRRAKIRIGAITAIIWLATAGGLGYAWIRLVQSRLPDDA